MEFRTTTVEDMLEGFMNNMSEEQIDKELKLFHEIACTMNVTDETKMGVVIDADHFVEEDTLIFLHSLVGYQPFKERNETSGDVFLYFKNLDDAEKAADYLRYQAQYM